MEINKAIAKREMQIFGGTPKVVRYHNEENSKSIDILTCVNAPQNGIKSCASIGLNSVDIGLVSENNTLRVELLGAVDISVESFENIIASVSFDIMDSCKCYPGYIAVDTIETYISDSDMKHVLLTDPFIWSQAESVLINNECIAWLMAVPISEREFEYANESGTDALEQLFEDKQIDIFNIYRQSVV